MLPRPAGVLLRDSRPGLSSVQKTSVPDGLSDVVIVQTVSNLHLSVETMSSQWSCSGVFALSSRLWLGTPYGTKDKAVRVMNPLI